MSFEDCTRLTITVVYDNIPYQEGLTTAWGFACVIRTPQETILFDTGADGVILLENMARAGIDPRSIDHVVLSHQHWDHVGGIYHFLHQRANVKLSVPRSFSASLKNDFMRCGVELSEIDAPAQIGCHVWSSGELPGIIGEQALYVQTEHWLIIITGCAHPGIVQLIRAIQALTPERIVLVMGGFHLKETPLAQIAKIIENMQQLGVRAVAPSHCTGAEAIRAFEQAYHGKFFRSGVGKTLTLEDLATAML